jgi:tetratricopeptide (TPR) repeat protein
MGLSQLAFAALALLVVCSMVGATVGSAILDARRTGDAEDATNLPDREAPLIQEQRDRIAANPNDAAAMVLLAQLLANEGELTEAITWYERALSLNPNDLAARNAFAQDLALAGNYRDAEFQYRRALEIAPDDAQALFNLAELYENWQPAPRIAEAIPLYQRVIATSPTSVVAERAAGQLQALGVGTPAAVATPGSPAPGASPAP